MLDRSYAATGATFGLARILHQLVVLAIALAAQPAFTSVIEIGVDPERNLIYHLDCLTGVFGCSKNTFVGIWAELPTNERDQAWLEQWLRVREHRASSAYTLISPAPATHPLDSPVIDSPSSPVALDAKEFEVLAHFQPRFDAWWKQGSGNHAELMRLSLKHLSQQIALSDMLEQLATFHGLANSAPRRVEVHLISAAGEGRTATRAEMRGNEAFVETLIGETHTERVGVMAHEIAHYYYALTPARRREQIRDWFLADQRAVSIPAYNLLNEALASAFGNGLVEQRVLDDKQFREYLSFPDSFYANTYVDLTGKATLPLLSRYLAAGRRLDADFVTAYIGRVESALGKRMSDLGFWLRSLAFTTTSDTLSPLADVVGSYIATGALFQETIAGTCERPCLLQRYPELSGIVVTLNDDLDALAEFLPEASVTRIRREALVHGHALYGYQRSPRSLLFVVSGRTRGDVERGLEALFEMGQIFTGASSSKH